MNILLLTTYFPPDTSIAAVRPYMFAKYLSRLGHSVTVLRSGEINKRCEDFFEPLPDVRVISYLGENSPAELYACGKWNGIPAENASRISFLPIRIRVPLSKLFHSFSKQKNAERKLQRRLANHEKQKAALDALKNEKFDVVFSTAGEFENLPAGQYAAKLFSCPLIQDFRDPMAARVRQTRREYTFIKHLQDEALCNADICTAVSDGLLRELCSEIPEAKTAVLYNGYEPASAVNNPDKPAADVLTFCYTGQIYPAMQDFSPVLQALRTLSKAGRIDLNKIRIHYAGRDFDYLHRQADKLGVSEILVNHGHVGRHEAAKLQTDSDIFVVLSWNTKTEKGVLTGKFFEGIRAKKPILALVAGGVPHSELDLLCQRYHYGFCYENCRKKERFQPLCDYLEALYREKLSSGKLSYMPAPSLEKAFRYDTLAKQLESLCVKLTSPKE